MELERRSCPLCGSTAERREVAPVRFRPELLGPYSFSSRKRPERMHWRFAECGSCGLVYATETPTADWFLDGYRDAAYDSGDEARLAAETYAGLLARVASQLPSRDGAVDVGAGDGAFLERLLEAGFSGVRGFEPSAAPRAAAHADVRPLLSPEPFRADSAAPQSLAFASCLQTIEHVPEPVALCGEIARALRPGGAFLVVCHDAEAFSARVLGPRSPIFDLEHFQLFSRRTLERLLAGAGFERIEVHGIRNTYPLRYWLRLMPLPDALKRVPGPLGSLRLTLSAGNLWAVAYRP